jgi:alpha-L-rhamnosidase
MPVQLVAASRSTLVAQMIEPMQVTQVIHPWASRIQCREHTSSIWARIFYGTVRSKATGRTGTEVRMTSAYSLEPDGTLKTPDNRSALCTDVYTFKGHGTEVRSPEFKGQGSRRVKMTGFPERRQWITSKDWRFTRTLRPLAGFNDPMIGLVKMC